jgi:elongation factor P
MKISTNQFKNGLKILINNQPCSILEHEFHKPGKGQAVMRVRYRNLITSKVIDKTFKSGESVEQADVVIKEMDYLYNDGEFWFFMDPVSFDQVQVNNTIMEEASNWLMGQERCEVTTWNDDIISVEVPAVVELKISESEPGVKGDTVSGATKPATLETGIVIQVPLFINEGEVIKVDTRKREYAGRT